MKNSKTFPTRMDSCSSRHRNFAFRFEIMDKTQDLFCANQLYWKRIYTLQDKVISSPRNRYNIDDYMRLYKNIVTNALGEVIEKIEPEISYKEYVQLAKEKFLVYEIFDYFEKRDTFRVTIKEIKLVNILIYYPESQLCFVYKSKRSCVFERLLGFCFQKILRNVKKEDVDSMFLNRKRTWQHEEFLQTQPYRVSNIMNPDGFVHFPKEEEAFFEHYVNQTNKPYATENLKFFRNYLWIHYNTMNPIEKKYRKYILKIAKIILMKKNNLPCEIINHILTFV